MKYKQLLISILILIVAIISFCYSNITIVSFNSTINFILKIILPSLFPFMIFVNFIILGNSIDLLAKITKPIGKIFHLSGYGMISIISSILGGYPYSAILVSKFIENNKISKEEGLDILKYSFFPSFSFLFSSLKNINEIYQKEVNFICISLYLSSFILLFINNYKKKYNQINIKNKNIVLTELYFDVMNNSITSIFSISFSIILFNLLKNYLSLLITQPYILNLLSGLLEFSSTCISILNANNLNIIDFIILTFIISFSSLSIYFQISFYIKKVNLSIKKLIIPRLSVSILAICLFLLFYYFF